VVVVPDYPGLGTPGPHPYLVGRATGHALVDGIRAVGGLVGVDTSRSAIWGFSQGGHAALFAIEEAATIEDVGVVGGVLFAPATDLAGLIEAGQGSVAGTLLLVTTAVSWSEVYPDLELEDVVAAEAIDEAREVAARCLTATSLPASIVQSIRLRDVLVDIDDPRAAGWATVVTDNTPSAPLAVPVLVFHGDDDALISSEVTRDHVAERCRRGDPIEMRMVAGAGHFTLVSRTIDDAAAWTRARLRGELPTHVCPPPDEEPSRDPATEPGATPGDGGRPDGEDAAADDARGVGPLGARARPDWLGTQVLPRASTGFGEVRATPPELVDRRLVTPAHLPPPPTARSARASAPPTPRCSRAPPGTTAARWLPGTCATSR
jgi:alpha-beta hydrolase superfamily lysophospholipase